MNQDIMYIYLGMMENTVLSYGITSIDLLNDLKNPPEHLLLLTPVNYDILVDSHTGFNILSGYEEVSSYLRNKKIKIKKWIDYKDNNYLDELTPQELADILYMSHTANYCLHSPFYYKLGNHFTYLDLQNGMNKTYYRYLERFYHVFNISLLRHIKNHKLDQIFWIRLKQLKLTPLDNRIINDLRNLLVKGIVFNFSEMKLHKNILKIPIYYITHFVLCNNDWNSEQAVFAGFLLFDSQIEKWNLFLIK